MVLAEPRKKGLPLVDLVDFEYDKVDWRQYTQGVRHGIMLLDRKGKTRVRKSDWQADRTVFAKDRKGNILVFNTTQGYFTLYHLGRFFKQSKFNIHSAMNLDGGYKADIAIKFPDFRYVHYGQFETQGEDYDISVIGGKTAVPTAIGLFLRKEKGKPEYFSK